MNGSKSTVWTYQSRTYMGLASRLVHQRGNLQISSLANRLLSIETNSSKGTIPTSIHRGYRYSLVELYARRSQFHENRFIFNKRSERP